MSAVLIDGDRSHRRWLGKSCTKTAMQGINLQYRAFVDLNLKNQITTDVGLEKSIPCYPITCPEKNLTLQ
jgi:hypothetical protein